MHVAEEAGAHWLLDAIAICQKSEVTVAGEEFQVWNLAVRADRTGTLVCEDGNGNSVYKQEIPFTDFPVDEMTLWFSSGVIHLPRVLMRRRGGRLERDSPDVSSSSASAVWWS